MKTIIFKNDSFVREAIIEPVDSLEGLFSLQFCGVLLASKDPNASHRNFEAILDRAGLESLQRLLDAVLKG
jgi:hypothetical protein